MGETSPVETVSRSQQNQTLWSKQC